jgi:hypothetical protein
VCIYEAIEMGEHLPPVSERESPIAVAFYLRERETASRPLYILWLWSSKKRQLMYGVWTHKIASQHINTALLSVCESKTNIHIPIYFNSMPEKKHQGQ